MIYDLIIIGGGPAGYRAAERAGQSGLKTILFEKRALGGVCLNEGCIPSKTLLNSAKIYEHAIHGAAYGVTTEKAFIDQAKVIERKNKVVKALVSGVGILMKQCKVEVVRESAVITGKTSEGFTVIAAGITYTGKKLIIATGSEAIVPPIKGAREAYSSGYVMTNREILDLTVIPKNLVVIGGGVIGLEMVSYFSAVGSKVTVIEMLDKIAGPTEKEISSILQKNFESKGVTFILGAKVTEVTASGVVYEKDGASVTVPADKVLMSVGRRAVTRDIGLESIGVLTERGSIVTDEQLKTNIPGVFAAGDVNGKIMLAHTGYREADVAVNVILGKKDRINYDNIPSVIYTNPEVASVGSTLDAAAGKGIDAYEKKVPMNLSGRYLAENEGGNGIAKIVLEKGTNRILGFHMIGNPCSEIIFGAALMLEKKYRTADLETLVIPHPTVGEVMRELIM